MRNEKSEPVHKIRRSKGQRLLRLLGSAIDPRAWAHGFKIRNYYNYTHVAELRQIRMGRNVAISPTASFANGRNIEIGDKVSIGAHASLWAGSGTARIVIGSHVLIAPSVMITAANYRFNDPGLITAQAMDEVDVVIGSNVWIGYGAVILPGARIGDGAVVGAGAVVRGTVPDYAVIANEPARVIGHRTADASADPAPAVAAAVPAAAAADMDILGLIRRETGRSEDDLARPVDEIGIDSFDLVTLRTAIETATGRRIPDREWSGARCLKDIAGLPSLAAGAGTATPQPDASGPMPAVSAPAPAAAATPGRARRDYVLNMPQMALSGLAEPWLFKEIGDLHWQLITEFLKTPSSAIADEEGARLYATFTRIRIDVDPELRGFRENQPFSIASTLERYGASMYFADHAVEGPAARVRARTMSTFAKYGERGNNTSLVKGSPIIPDPEAVPAAPAIPEFAAEYRARRAEEPQTVIFECDYDILAPHDINGVGLLYFAAYPTIFDLCIERHEGPGFLMNHGTVSKDVLYFANAEPGERLRFALHEREVAADGTIRHLASLSRSSDGKRMAEAVSVKRPSIPPVTS